MAILSPARLNWPLLVGLKLMSRGKVRDTYDLGNGLLLVVATDAISIFDHVLNVLVPGKGISLTVMSVFWFRMLEKHGIGTHLVACGADIDEYLPPQHKDNIDLQSRAIVVKKCNMVDDTEFVLRGCLTGSGLKEYLATGTVCGQRLPDGLQDGDELPYLFFTPTTKAAVGHDEAVSADARRQKYPDQVYRAVQIFQIAQEYAKRRGFLLADTKFEFAGDGMLADEVLTMDSSRWWDLRTWQEGRRLVTGRKAPPGFDKQLVREWGKGSGVDKLKPEDPEDVAKVHAMQVPPVLIDQTVQVYRYAPWRLIGMNRDQYLRNEMRVQVPQSPTKNVVIICGSETDLPCVTEACRSMFLRTHVRAHTMSCHRNPKELMEFCQTVSGVDVIIGAGGKALALPGVIDAWLYRFGKNIPVVGVVFGESGSKALLAAELSIDELPGQPVIMDEISGRVYSGTQGLRDVLNRIECGELPPPKTRKIKPVQMDVYFHVNSASCT